MDVIQQGRMTNLVIWDDTETKRQYFESGLENT
ncbi:MAG: hypothetical protein GAK29_00288 [Acinetobacter bereziniae]|uniref:Uncharacterized protein n=1 Tax=Acinetobacter bereziniae TaxID=106648 RepID=A0A833PKL5_ACIBZ|nr:MAG: hypothetical protein GAK29_00288 [Acinetobacter bereziniae]